MKPKCSKYLPSFSSSIPCPIHSKIIQNGFLFTSCLGTCGLFMYHLRSRSQSLGIFFFFLAHAKHPMQQPHAEVFETQIGRSGSQKLCFEAFLQRVLSKKVFLPLIKKALSFLILLSVLDSFPKLLILIRCGEISSCLFNQSMVVFWCSSLSATTFYVCTCVLLSEFLEKDRKCTW